MRSLKFLQPRCTLVLTLLTLALTSAAPAQTFTKLADLTTTTGTAPESPLTQGLDGNLYGTATSGGAYLAGTFFQLTPSGTVTTLYNFCLNNVSDCPDGATPWGAIALGTDGDFYGATLGNVQLQADEGDGTIYKISTAGSLTTLYNFDSCTRNCSANPTSGLTLARNGDFYGVSGPTSGSPSAFDNLVFKISSSGTFNRVLVVCPNQICPTDAGPSSTLLQASGGNLIGSGLGGANNAGAIYKMTPSGTPTVFYSFCADSICHDGYQANNGPLVGSRPLIEAAGGDIYGANLLGGSGANCHSTGGCGTVFRVTASGAFTKLHDFGSWAGSADGIAPTSLIQATDGNFYGTTEEGGTHNDGTVFKLTAGGHLTVLHSFDNTDGFAPVSLYQATDGNLYGTNAQGGLDNGGTLFRISLGLSPFVRTVQEAGEVGAPVIIFGNGLTGAASVSFNGTAATFAVVSDTEITATVPAGATTGSIQVVTASSATLSSNAEFVVLP